MKSTFILALIAPFALSGCLIVSKTHEIRPPEPEKAAAAPTLATAAAAAMAK
jgi:hypothetical protein